MPTDDLETYRQRVARVLAGNSEEMVLNGSVSHARVVFEEAFRVGSSEIDILTNKISSILDNGEVIKAALSFLRLPSAKVNLLIEKFPFVGDVSQSSFINNIRNVGGDRLDVRLVPEGLAKNYAFNFMTVDEKSYRFEDDRSVPVATIAGGWGAQSTVMHLRREFKKLAEASESVGLIPA